MGADRRGARARRALGDRESVLVWPQLPTRSRVIPRDVHDVSGPPSGNPVGSPATKRNKLAASVSRTVRHPAVQFRASAFYLVPRLSLETYS